MKMWMIIATCMILVGLVLCGYVLATAGGELKKLGTASYVTNTYQPAEAFADIEVETIEGDVIFLRSEADECKVVCYEQDRVRHRVEVREGTLYIEADDQRKWYDYIGIHFGTPKVTVYLPGQTYDELSVRSVTGDVEIPGDFSFEAVDISVSTGDVRCAASTSGRMEIQVTTGDVKLVDVTCGKLVTGGSTGDIRLENVIATESFFIERTTGDVCFVDCDAPKITVEVSTGDVTGSLLSGKNFVVSTSTGKIRVPEDTAGGRCQITSSTGNITISVES